MLLTIIVFILILGLLIFVHEFGHFITARRSGVKVEEFGFGFPPRIWGIKKGETIYSINWIPLGGFVKIKGEDGKQREDKDSFSYQPIWRRGIILSAGVLMNVVLAFVMLSIGFMFGLPSSISDEELNKPYVSQLKVQVAAVVDGSPASQAGIEPGDQILKIDDQEVLRQNQVINYINDNQDKEITLLIKNRKGEVSEVTAQPVNIEGFSENKVLGINIIQSGIVKYGFFESWYYGFMATVNLLIRIILAFYGLIKNLILGMGISVDLAGPVGVAIITGQVVDLGFRYIWQFTALLSLNLAIINFLPIPALDGGRFLFLIIEKIRRKPINQKIENTIHNIGFSLLMLLIVMITYRDIVRYGGGVIEKIKGLF